MNDKGNVIRYMTSDGQGVWKDSGKLRGVLSHTFSAGEGVITFKNRVLTIAKGAFHHCANLESITLPDCVTKIDDFAFHGCKNLKTITLPQSLRSIGKDAFQNCESLTEVEIPKSVRSIGDGAFESCKALTTFRGKYASEDGRCLVVDGRLVAFAPCGVEVYVIFDGITEIGYSAFAHNENLKKFYIADGVTEIGANAFIGCINLETIVLPHTLTSILMGAFFGCQSLRSVTIPPAVMFISSFAFLGCLNLESITCLAIAPPTLCVQALPSEVVVYVPREAVEAYRRHDVWGEYRIEAME